MGYDRDDVAYTCGDRDDRQISIEELAHYVRSTWSGDDGSPDPFVLAAALLARFDVLRLSSAQVISP